MAVHERAWQGINLVIYGKVPLLPMQIEQAIAAVSPGNEVKIDSFEHFEDAYDFCKDRQDVGFLFILDNCGDVAPHNAFSQLARHYEDRGLPCFGALIYAEQEQFIGHRSLQVCNRFLDYLPSQSLKDAKLTAQTLQSLWRKYIERFEQHVVPEALQSSIHSLIEKELPRHERIFLERATTILTSNLNLSWMEMFSLRWVSSLRALEKANPSFFGTLRMLRQLSSMASYEGATVSLESIEGSTAPLIQRTAMTLTLLVEAHRKGTLEAFLESAKQRAKPGAPVLVRHLHQYAESLRRLSAEIKAEQRKSAG